jgi:hypothetical protein
MNSKIEDSISFAILDGQNQIHDLRDKKATPDEITERMHRSFKFHSEKIEEEIEKERERVLQKIWENRNFDLESFLEKEFNFTPKK